MPTVRDHALEVLVDRCRVVFDLFINACACSRGDLVRAEEAMASALMSVRSELVTSGMELCVRSADRCFWCPECGEALTHWGTDRRSVVTSVGEGTFPSERYRCRSCRTSYYPWQVAHGLDEKQQFTLSARQLIAQEAACGPYDETSDRLRRMGISISPSEVDRIAREVATWRKQEQEVVRSRSAMGDRLLSVPLQNWSSWPAEALSEDVVVISVDGAKIRSTQVGPKGLEWFEARSGIIRLSREECSGAKICVGGVMEADQLFETMRSQWWQAPAAWLQKEVRTIFIADGADWIWDRAGWYFPHCMQILDIYHAAEHVASAAKAAWGLEHAHAKRWASSAISWLLEQDGPRQILRALIGVLRSGRAVDPASLITEIRYLWRHRRRMKYQQWKSQGLPVGSGAMESTIKQLCTQRLRLAGMKWTRKNADLILHLRAAVLSKSLSLTVERERRIRANRATKFNRPNHAPAIAV
jgi:hypothetical protein